MSYKNNRLFYRLLQVLYKGAEWRPVAGDQPQVQNGHDTLTTGIAFRYTVKKKTTNKSKNRQTKKPRAMWTYALGMLTGQANIDSMSEKTHETKLPGYLRLHLWDQP